MTSALAAACAMLLRHHLEGVPPQTVFLERGMSIFSEQATSGAPLSCARIIVTGAIFKQPACERVFFFLLPLFSFSLFFLGQARCQFSLGLLVDHIFFHPDPEPICICILRWVKDQILNLFWTHTVTSV